MGNLMSTIMLPNRAFTVKVTKQILRGMKKIPMPSDNFEELRLAFVKLVKDEKAKGKSQTDIADAIGVLPNYVSNIVNKRKGLGDEVIAKIDDKYPNWRTIEDDKAENGKAIDAKPKFVFTGIAEFKKQLNYFFDGMSNEHKEALVQMANKLHEIDNDDPKSAPFKGIERREKAKQ
jgi:transcriptional regulator with XRE-family HTH domain